MSTIPADAALLQRHLKSARDHVRHAIGNVEGLAGRPGADLDALYRTRRELKHLADVLCDISDAAEAM
jgi:hypothetical protein